MRPNVVRRIATLKAECTAAKCDEKIGTSYAGRVHAARTGHTVRETRVYKIGVRRGR